MNAKNCKTPTGVNEEITVYKDKPRKHVRVPFMAEVTYIAPGSNERLTCSQNLSENGILIKGASNLPVGKNIKLIFRLSHSSKKEIIVTAKSIWGKFIYLTGKVNIGLKFSSIDKIAQEQIRKYTKNISHKFAKS